MKTNLLIRITTACLLLFISVLSFGQGNSCNTATPFCSNGLDPYPAGVGVPAPPVGNNYDCLFTQPNPAWFYLNITQSGSLDFTLDNTNGLDIDFVLYGPFPNLATAFSQCGGMGNGGISGGIAACSYSGAAVEPVNVANVVVGQVYVLLITNFSNQPTDIFATANSGTGNYACDCQTDVNFALAPPAFNDAVLLDTTEFSVDFAVCSGGQVGFTIDVRADSITDSIGIYLPATNIGNVFGPANVSVFGPTYPIPGRYDTANFVVFINTDPSHVGLNNAVLSILNSGCVQDININVNVIGIDGNTSDTSLCAGIAQTVQLNSVSTALAGGAYQWTQISGPICTINNDTIANPLVSIPASTVAGDSVVFAIDFQSLPDTASGLSCFSTDTVVVYFVATPLALSAAASDYSLCQNGLANPVQFNASASGPGIDSTLGVYVWTSNPANFASQLSATNISNPIGQIVGTPGATVDYFIQYNYGACAGRDTVRLTFGSWVADVTPAADTICPGQSVPLSASPGASACGPTYVVANIPYAPIAGAGTAAPLACDDCLSGSLPIGFNFDFFCTTYTEFDISSNGYITFDLNSFNPGCCSGQILPDAFDPNNLIALAWEDLNPGSCGTVTYFTTGTAPNRRLVVSFNNVCYFGATTPTVSGQIILYETSNVVEIHTTSISSNFSIMTQGIENAGGTAGYAVPGRNAVDFVATNDAWRFTPQLTFLPTYAWVPTTAISSTTTQNVSVSPSNTTTYTVSVTEGGCTMVDSARITIQSPLATPVVSCGTPTGSSVTFNWNTIAGASSYEYSVDGGSTWISAGANTTTTIGGLGQSDTVNILVRAIASSGACTISPAGAQSCISDFSCNVPLATIVVSDNSFCTGSNAYIVATALSGGTLPFMFDLGAGLLDTAYAVNDTLFAGIAPGTYSVTITDLASNCINTTTLTVLGLGAPVNVSVQQTTAIACGSNTGAALVANTISGSPISYLWSNGETTAAISGLGIGTYSVVASDATGTCVDRDTVIITVPFVPTLNAWVGLLGQDSVCIFQGETTVLNAGANETGVSYLWSPTTGVTTIDSFSTTVLGVNAGNISYIITATSLDGCETMDTVILCVNLSSFKGLPTAFSPNGDGDNETFGPVGLIGATVTRFEVYNRWGQKVHNATDGSPWDGTKGGAEQPRDVYMYVFEYQFPADPAPTTIRGTVTLLK